MYSVFAYYIILSYKTNCSSAHLIGCRLIWAFRVHSAELSPFCLSLSALPRLWKINVLQLAVFSLIYFTRSNAGRCRQCNSDFMNIFSASPTSQKKKHAKDKLDYLYMQICSYTVGPICNYTHCSHFWFFHIKNKFQVHISVTGVNRGERSKFLSWMGFQASQIAKAWGNGAKLIHARHEGDQNQIGSITTGVQRSIYYYWRTKQ